MYTYLYENDQIIKANEFSILFDFNGNIVQKTLKNSISYAYDNKGNITNQYNTFTGGEQKYSYRYIDEDNSSYVLELPTGAKSSGKDDHLGRKEFKELSLGTGFVSQKYSYVKGEYDSEKLNGNLKSIPTTTLVSRIEYDNNVILDYTYDSAGNISTVTKNGILQDAYFYDGLNRLKSEQCVKNETYTYYTYDKGGNIVKREKFDCYGSTIQITKPTGTPREIINYSYGDSIWRDKLTNYNGQAISYDAIGNPIKYRGKSLVWEKGRQLKSYDNLTFTYNASGIRTSKTVSGVKHSYALNGTDIIRETYGGVTLDYLYDKDNEVCGFIHNGTAYYYYKNLQGDIISITDANGNIITNYHYDAWGKVVDIDGNTEIGNLNPFRYRAYYFDTESGLYYLNSRYYDPETGRFINSDDTDYIIACEQLHYNLFAYCNNNPISNVDINGFMPDKISQYVKESWIFKLVKKYKISDRPYRMLYFRALGFEMELLIRYDRSSKLPIKLTKKSFSASFKAGSIALGWGGKLEMDLGISVGRYGLNFMRGIDWKRSYIALTINYASKDGKYTASCQLYISVSHLLKLAIAALVVGACVVLPMLAPVFSKFASLITTSKRNFVTIMKFILSKIQYIF